jgi:hypothetical protein
MISMGWLGNCALPMGVGAAALAMAACSSVVFLDSSPESEPGPGGATSTASSTVTVGTGGQGGVGGAPAGDACATINHETELGKKPADIIFMIDNSSSMGEETMGVEANINVNFAQIMGISDVDYQVLMVTKHGWGGFDVCVEPPLSGTTDCGGPPINVPGRFYHYSMEVESHDSLCKVLDGMYGSKVDDFGLAPNGYDQWLRPAAVKIFVEISDDGVTCTHNGQQFDDGDDIQQGQQAAAAWDQTLLLMNPVQFGSQLERNYLFYSIVGMWWKNDKSAYAPDEPVVNAPCPGGVAGGTGYQWLSKGTGALRFPVCSHESYDAVFSDIAAGVIDVTAVPCEWDMPEPAPGDTYDPDTIDVTYAANGMGTPTHFTPVDNEGQCVSGGFYIEPGPHVVLCPQTCDTVRADNNAELEANVWCE